MVVLIEIKFYNFSTYTNTAIRHTIMSALNTDNDTEGQKNAEYTVKVRANFHFFPVQQHATYTDVYLRPGYGASSTFPS